MFFTKIWNFFVLYLDLWPLKKKKEDEDDWTIYINPDGSRGGIFTSSSKIGKNVYIHKTATVVPNVDVPDNTKIEKIETYFGDNNAY